MRSSKKRSYRQYNRQNPQPEVRRVRDERLEDFITQYKPTKAIKKEKKYKIPMKKQLPYRERKMIVEMH